MDDRSRDILTDQGRIVEGSPDVVGLHRDDIEVFVKALEDLRRARKVKYTTLSRLYARGLITSKGKIKGAGRAFLEKWREVQFVTAPPKEGRP